MKIDQEDFNRKAQHIIDTVVKPQVERYEQSLKRKSMEGKYIILDLRTMDYFKTKYGELKLFDSQDDACEYCGMYEFPNAWVCKLIFNHIEKN